MINYTTLTSQTNNLFRIGWPTRTCRLGLGMRSSSTFVLAVGAPPPHSARHFSLGKCPTTHCRTVHLVQDHPWTDRHRPPADGNSHHSKKRTLTLAPCPLFSPLFSSGVHLDCDCVTSQWSSCRRCQAWAVEDESLRCLNTVGWNQIVSLELFRPILNFPPWLAVCFKHRLWVRRYSQCLHSCSVSASHQRCSWSSNTYGIVMAESRS